MSGGCSGDQRGATMMWKKVHAGVEERVRGTCGGCNLRARGAVAWEVPAASVSRSSAARSAPCAMARRGAGVRVRRGMQGWAGRAGLQGAGALEGWGGVRRAPFILPREGLGLHDRT